MKRNKYSLIIGLGILLFVGVKLIGCSSSKEVTIVRSGAQLWGESCSKCHNAPSPETFSDVEWDVAVMHMRVRAKLTEEEASKIAEFLKIAN